MIVNPAEDRRVQPDPEHKGDHRQERESRGFAQLPQSETKIGHHRGRVNGTRCRKVKIRQAQLDSAIFSRTKISSNSIRRQRATLSASLAIVIAQLRDQDLIAGPPVDNPVLGGNAPRPISLKNVLQRLGFADTRVGIARYFFDQQIDSRNDLWIGALPVEVILPGLGRKDQVHALDS